MARHTNDAKRGRERHTHTQRDKEREVVRVRLSVCGCRVSVLLLVVVTPRRRIDAYTDGTTNANRFGIHTPNLAENSSIRQTHQDNKRNNIVVRMTMTMTTFRSRVLLLLLLLVSHTVQSIKTRLTWVNGVGYSLQHMEEGKKWLSDVFGGKEVLYCHNPTSKAHDDDTMGYLGDLTQAGTQKLGRTTEEVNSLVE